MVVSAVTPRRSSTISFTRDGVRCKALARAFALISIGSKYSLRKISPGCTGRMPFLKVIFSRGELNWYPQKAPFRHRRIRTCFRLDHKLSDPDTSGFKNSKPAV